MMNRQRYFSFLALFLSMGCGDLTETASEPVSEGRQEIINGTLATQAAGFNSLVAIYHKEYVNGVYTWFQRPCSGMFVNKGWVITARHCATTNGTVDGPLVGKADIALNVNTAPGYNGPPQYSSGIAQIFPASTTGSPDIALLRVGNDTSCVSTTYNFPTIATGTPYSGEPYEAFGYGRSAYGPSADSPEVGLGAGELRSAVMKVGTVDTSATTFNFVANSAGQITYHGDSGGPSFVRLMGNDFPYTAPILLSIHSTVSTETYISSPVRNWIGHVALFDIPIYQFWNGTVGDHFYSTTTSAASGWVYEKKAFYLAHPGTGGTVPFYRFYGRSHHFYTTNYAEGANAGFTYEGTPGNVFPSSANSYASVVPLYRYYHPSIGDHYYTTTYGTYSGWNYEMIAGYVHLP